MLNKLTEKNSIIMEKDEIIKHLKKKNRELIMDIRLLILGSELDKCQTYEDKFQYVSKHCSNEDLEKMVKFIQKQMKKKDEKENEE